MKNSFALFLCFVFSFSMLSAFGSEKVERIEIEKNFETKLRHFYPENKFSLSVTLKEKKSHNFTLFGEVIVDDEIEIIKKISSVKVLTDSVVSRANISQILGLSINLVTLEKYDFKRPLIITGKLDSALYFVSKFQITLIFFGIICIIFCILIATFIIKNSILSIPAPIAEAFGQLNESMDTPKQKKVEQKEILDQKKYPKSAQLKALFSDLYWAHRDSEAAYLLRQYQEIEIYQELSFGLDYVQYLKNIRPEVFNVLEDPYYLSPNDAFLEMSISDMSPEYFLNCSKIRLILCSHSSYELATLRLSSNKLSVAIEAKKSLKRELIPPFVFKFSTTKEELDFLSTDLPEYIKHQSPSLYLFSKLSDAAFTEVEKNFSVKDLAECWIGPEAILSIIRSRLPERKGELLDQILKSGKNIPNRENDKFLQILKRARIYADLGPSSKVDNNSFKLVV